MIPNGIDVFAVGTNNYLLKSFNWWDEDSDRVHDNISTQPLTGMQINLQDGIFEAYAENGADATNWFRIDASYDSIKPLLIGNRESPAFQVAWDGSVSINGSHFNIDADGNFWINGETLSDAIFSVTNAGVVSMKSGSIELGSVTQADGSEVTAFYVDDDGNLTIGGTAFTVNKNGAMTATSGSIGVLTLDGATGTITATKNGTNTFTINGTTGLLEAVNATLTTLTVVDTLIVKSPTGTTNQAQLTVQGSTAISGDTTIQGSTTIKGSINLSGDILMPYGDLCTAAKDENDKTTGAFISFGNGGGNIWVYGDFYIAANSGASSGQTGRLIVQDTANFNKPDSILFGTQTLPQYIATTVGLVTEGEITSIGYAQKASQLTNTSKTPYSRGDAATPIYFDNGIPVACTETFATQSWVTDKDYATETWVTNKGYATETWVTNKGYLTSIPDDIVRDDDIADFVTSSTTSLTNYVLKDTYEEKIEELEGIIETLQNEIETLKNNSSSGGDSSTEES